MDRACNYMTIVNSQKVRQRLAKGSIKETDPSSRSSILTSQKAGVMVRVSNNNAYIIHITKTCWNRRPMRPQTILSWHCGGYLTDLGSDKYQIASHDLGEMPCQYPCSDYSRVLNRVLNRKIFDGRNRPWRKSFEMKARGWTSGGNVSSRRQWSLVQLGKSDHW